MRHIALITPILLFFRLEETYKEMMAGKVQCVVLFLVVTIVGVCTAMVIDTKRSSSSKAYTPIKPYIPFKDMDPIDACLFTCNMCFVKEEVGKFYFVHFKVAEILSPPIQGIKDYTCVNE